MVRNIEPNERKRLRPAPHGEDYSKARKNGGEEEG